MSEITDLRVDVAMASRVLARRNLAHDIIGHVSARLAPESDRMWIRCRSDVEDGLARTTPDSIREIRVDGNGDPGAGYDLPLELPIHGAIMQARSDVCSVVHAHPPYAVLCGLAEVPLRRVYGAYDSDGMLLLDEGIPTFSRSRLISTWDLGKELAETLAGKNACLLRGHGIVTAGRSVGEAILRALRLERLCWVMWQLKLAGAADSVPEIGADDLQFFTDPGRMDISRSTERRWRAYRSEVED